MAIRYRVGLALVLSLLAANATAADVLDVMEAGDYEKAVSMWHEMAAQGDGQAQFNLGLMYHSGMGVELSEPTAVEWYQRAAENGYGPAQVYMVVGYEEGWFGLPQDSGRAEFWRGMLKDSLE